MRRYRPRGRPAAAYRQTASAATSRSFQFTAGSPAVVPRHQSATSLPAFSPDDADVAWVRHVTMDGKALVLRQQQDVRAGVGSIGLKPRLPRSRSTSSSAAAGVKAPKLHAGAAPGRTPKPAAPSTRAAVPSDGSSSSDEPSPFVRARRLPDCELFEQPQPAAGSAPPPPPGGDPIDVDASEDEAVDAPPPQQWPAPPAVPDSDPPPETPLMLQPPQPQPQQQQQQPEREQQSAPCTGSGPYAIVPYRHRAICPPDRQPPPPTTAVAERPSDAPGPVTYCHPEAAQPDGTSQRAVTVLTAGSNPRAERRPHQRDGLNRGPPVPLTLYTARPPLRTRRRRSDSRTGNT